MCATSCYDPDILGYDTHGLTVGSKWDVMMWHFDLMVKLIDSIQW
jgi:hypothetical protein